MLKIARMGNTAFEGKFFLHDRDWQALAKNRANMKIELKFYVPIQMGKLRDTVATVNSLTGWKCFGRLAS